MVVLSNFYKSKKILIKIPELITKSYLIGVNYVKILVKTDGSACAVGKRTAAAEISAAAVA